MTSVTIVSAFATMGGSEQWILQILDRAQGRLDPRFVVLQDGPFVAAIRSRGIPVQVLPTGARPWHIMSAGRQVRRLLAADPPDVIVGNGVKAMLVGMPAARSLKIPSVWVKHDHSFDRIVARPLGRTVTTVVATAAEVGAPTGRTDLVVVEPPRPPDPLPIEEARAGLAERGVTPTSPTVAMISRLVPYKGVDVAIEALAAAPEWQLLVIGGNDASSPHERDRLQDLAYRQGVAQRVVFAGEIPAAGRYLAAVDVLTVQTRPDGGRNAPTKEGYGIVATEAMLAGVPVIMAGEGPIATRLATPDGPAGIVVPQSDPTATADALRRLADPVVRHRMGLAGQRAARDHPDEQAVADRVVAAILEAAR